MSDICIRIRLLQSMFSASLYPCVVFARSTSIDVVARSGSNTADNKGVQQHCFVFNGVTRLCRNVELGMIAPH